MNNASFISVALTTSDKLEPYQIISTNETPSLVLLITITVAVIVGIFLYGLIIKFILKQPSPKRAVDKIMLLDQSIQALAFSTLGILALVMLWSNKSVKDLFGELGCLAISIAQPVFMWQRVIGSLGLSIFRFAVLEKPKLVEKVGMQKFERIIRAAQVGFCVVPVFISILNSLADQGPVPRAVCEGIPLELAEALKDKSQDQIEKRILHLLWQSLVVMRVGFMGVDFALNCKLFIGYWRQTMDMKASISTKWFNNRRKKSVINLKGHLILFAVNLVLDLVAVGGLNKSTMLGLEGWHYYGVGFVCGAVSGIGTLLASPEMRREYLGTDDSLWPIWNRTSPPPTAKGAIGGPSVDLEDILNKLNRHGELKPRSRASNESLELQDLGRDNHGASPEPTEDLDDILGKLDRGHGKPKRRNKATNESLELQDLELDNQGKSDSGQHRIESQEEHEL